MNLALPHNIFISDLNAGVVCTITKVADVTKLGGDVHCLEGKGASQRNLDWGENWTIFISVKLNELLPDSEGGQTPSWVASHTAQPESQQGIVLLYLVRAVLGHTI